MTQDTNEHRISAVDSEGNKVDEPVLINGENPLVGGGGGAFVDDDGDGDAELQSENADFQGGDAKNVGAMDAERVSSGRTNNVVWADAGSLQSAADEAGSNASPYTPGVVALKPWETYMNEPLQMPSDTILYSPGASLQTDNDTQTVLDLSAHGAGVSGILNIQTSGASSYSADVVVVDTGAVGDRINLVNQDQLRMNAKINLFGSSGEGTGVRLIADGNPITMGSDMEFCVRGYQDQLVFQTDGSYINGQNIRFSGMLYGRNAIRHETTGTAGAADTRIHGTIQCESTPAAISNQTSEGSVNFVGDIIDTQYPTTSVIQGPNIRVMNSRNNIHLGNTTFDSGTVVNQQSHQSLGGSAPDATNWVMGDIIHDTDNNGDAYLVYDPSSSSGATRIGN